MQALARRASLCLFALAATFTTLLAEDAPDRKELAALSQKLQQQFSAKEYPGAEETCRALVKILPKEPSFHYNLACALAQQNKTKDALTELDQAVTLGFTDGSHMASDHDLMSLRGEKEFETLIKKAEASLPPPEKGIDLPGLKTVDFSPPSGLPYRLRMSPDATKEKPNRLLIWFHPSGASANQAVEAHAPQLVKEGWAVLVFTRKNWAGWTGDDLAKLNVSMKHLEQTQPGIRTEKPLVWGFSAGGQLILQLWKEKPEQFAGCIIGSAYPIEMAPGNPLIKLPENAAIKDVPFFATVGDADPGHTVWKKAEPEWEKAGIPLTIKYVPKHTHPMWPFKGEIAKELLEWVKKILALPAK